MTDEQFNRIVSLLDQIASCLRDQNTLAVRRERDAQRKKAKRHKECPQTEESPLPCVHERIVSAPVPEEQLPPVIDLAKTPTLNQVLWHAHHTCNFYDDTWTHRWFNTMTEFQWCDNNGKKIGNWKKYFHSWRENEAFFKKLRDPERLPDARRPAPAPARRKADNWHGTRKEDIQDVLCFTRSADFADKGRMDAGRPTTASEQFEHLSI